MPRGASGATLWLLDETATGPAAYPLPGPQLLETVKNTATDVPMIAASMAGSLVG
ncbi:hypothetical protein ACX80V_18800 [Arthrobacter sp. MDT3-24]